MRQTRPIDPAAARAEERTTLEIRMELRQMTINLLRILAGAGRPQTLFIEVFRLATAVNEYQASTGHLPDFEDIILKEVRQWDGGPEAALNRSEVWLADNQIICGAMRVVACMLDGGMPPLMRRAMQQMSDGIEALTAARARHLRKALAEKTGNGELS